MKGIVKYGSHLTASLFLFFIIGLSAALLLDQITWVDMRFASEYMIAVFLGIGLWFFFVVLFMNAQHLVLWRQAKILVAVLIFLLFAVAVVWFAGGMTTLPAYMTRKALFLQDVLRLSNVNLLLLLWVGIGAGALFLCRKYELAFERGAPIQWSEFKRSTRLGIYFSFFFIGLFVLFYLGQGEFRQMMNYAAEIMARADIESFRDYLLTFGPWAAVVSAFLMIFQSVVAPLPAFVITFTNGLLFGWFWGAVLSWSSAMAGAVLCFYFSKFFGRPVVEKWLSRRALLWADGFFDTYGKHAVFIARLVPIVSFDLVSYAAGLTSIRFWHFFWATGLGQLPATVLYSYLGQSATSTVKILFFLFTIVIALGLIGALLKPKFKQMKSKT